MRESSALPRTLEARLAAVARKLGKPRRVVLKEALEEYAARHDQAAMVAAMNRVAQAVDTRLDADLASAGSRILERTEW